MIFIYPPAVFWRFYISGRRCFFNGVHSIITKALRFTRRTRRVRAERYALQVPTSMINGGNDNLHVSFIRRVILYGRDNDRFLTLLLGYLLNGLRRKRRLNCRLFRARLLSRLDVRYQFVTIRNGTNSTFYGITRALRVHVSFRRNGRGTRISNGKIMGNGSVLRITICFRFRDVSTAFTRRCLLNRFPIRHGRNVAYAIRLVVCRNPRFICFLFRRSRFEFSGLRRGISVLGLLLCGLFLLM